MNPFKLQATNQKIELSEIYGNVRLYPYARYALYEFLRVNNISSVYVPSFICRDLLSSINELGIKYYYYDLDDKFVPQLEDIQCDAILFVNYFGFEQDISPYRDYKNKFGSLIIEDNAHGFLSKGRSGEWLATRGDVGLLSIRKTVFLPNGAALVIPDNFSGQVPDDYSFGQTDQDKKYNLKSKLKRLFFLPQLGLMVLLLLRLIRYWKTGSAIPLPDTDSEVHLPDNQFITPILNSRNVSFNLDKERQKRIKSYQFITRVAEKFNISPLFELYDGVMPFEFAFVDNGMGDKFETELYKHGLFVLPWPDLPDEVVDRIDTKFSNIKVVPFLW